MKSPGTPQDFVEVLRLKSNANDGVETTYVIEMNANGIRAYQDTQNTAPVNINPTGWNYVGLRFDGEAMSFHVNGGKSNFAASTKLASEVELTLGDVTHDMIFDELWIGPTSEQKRQVIFENQSGAAMLTPDFPVMVTYP